MTELQLLLTWCNCIENRSEHGITSGIRT